MFTAPRDNDRTMSAHRFHATRSGRVTGLSAGRAAAMAVVLPLLLSGCLGLSAPLTLAGSELMSMSHTGKSLTDHAVSFATGDDCSVKNAKQEGEYCVDEAEAAARIAAAKAAETPLYCYHTLGEITCYNRMDPYGIHGRRAD